MMFTETKGTFRTLCSQIMFERSPCSFHQSHLKPVQSAVCQIRCLHDQIIIIINSCVTEPASLLSDAKSD